MTTIFQGSMNGGEITPRLGGRVDLTKYTQSLKTCLNMLPQPHGGVTRRPGTEYIGACKHADKLARLVPFEYSTEQAYQIEFGDSYCRFYMDGGQVQSYDAYAMMNLHGDGDNASVTITDSTGRHTVTPVGGCKISTGTKKIGSGSIYFPGTAGSYLTIADSADWNKATDPFTDEMYLYLDTLPSAGEAVILYSQYEDYCNYAAYYLLNAGGTYYLNFKINDASTVSRPVNYATWTAPAEDTWHHNAVLRGWASDGDQWNVCVDGIGINAATDTVAYPDLTAALNIGSGQVEILSALPTNDATHVKATTYYNNNYLPHFATDQTKSLVGIEETTTWVSSIGAVTNQRFHVDLGASYIITRIYYEASHGMGGNTDVGVRHFTFWGSNSASAFADTTYATDTGWTQITTSASEFDKHAVANAADPKYITATNATAYRYYAFKFADNWGNATFMGLRHVELREANVVPLNGYVDELFMSKGECRHTADFTPSSTAHPLSGNTSVYEVTTTYLESELATLKFTQSADTLYIVHPNHRPATLTRSAHDNWTLADIDFNPTPYGDANATAITLDPSATAIGVATVVASDSLFDDNWVGDDILFSNGYFNIATVNSATEAGINISSTLSAHTASATWSRAAWNADDGFPAAIAFYEDRLAFAATSAKPQTMWLSESGDYTAFGQSSPIVDTDSCEYTINSDQVNAIRWLAATKSLIAGTTGAEFLVTGGGTNEPLTPSSIKISCETAYGSANLQPIRVGNTILFVQRAGKSTGKTVREFGYSYVDDAYRGMDMSILAEHLTRTASIKACAFQKVPHQVLWCVLDDGDLIALTYLRDHEVVAWSHHTTDGDFEDVSVIPGEDEDEVWFVVKRTIDGSVVRYIERMKPYWDGSSVADAFYVDCGLTYDGAAINSATGLGHLEGESVAVLADGVVNAATTVSSGYIGLTTAASVIQVGLPITSDVETLRCGPVEMQGKTKRITDVTLRFFETAGDVYMGPDSSTLDTTDMGATPVDEDHKFSFQTGYDTDGHIFIRKTDCLPMTILAVVPELESYP